MLMENIQRSDLTVYEQAQGFQMMLDMGCPAGVSPRAWGTGSGGCSAGGSSLDTHPPSVYWHRREPADPHSRGEHLVHPHVFPGHVALPPPQGTTDRPAFLAAARRRCPITTVYWPLLMGTTVRFCSTPLALMLSDSS